MKTTTTMMTMIKIDVITVITAPPVFLDPHQEVVQSISLLPLQRCLLGIV